MSIAVFRLRGIVAGLTWGIVYFWVLPTSAVGLLVIGLCLPLGIRVRWINGVLEACGRPIGWALDHLTPFCGGASALTLGHVVLGQDELALEVTRAHERVHVEQAQRWGPLFIPAYLAASLYVWLRGRDVYWDNPFEREAYDRAP